MLDAIKDSGLEYGVVECSMDLEALHKGLQMRSDIHRTIA